MGLMDNLKQSANNIAQSVNETVAKGQSSMDAAASRKHADALLRDLGALVYARDTDRATPTADADIARLTADLRAVEAQGGVVDLELKAGPPPNAAPPPPAADEAPPPSGAPVRPRPREPRLLRLLWPRRRRRPLSLPRRLRARWPRRPPPGTVGG